MKRGSIIANMDWLTVLLYLFMISLGWLNIYSAVYTEEHPEILNLSQRYGKQFMWIIASIALAVLILLIDHKFYDFFAFAFYGFAIVLLLLVVVVGKEINGAKSWFMIGGFQIQPSEFAKPAVAIALAKYLSGFNLKINSLKTYFYSAAIIFTPSLLILLQPDTGSALVFFVFILVVFREGFPVSILLTLISLVVLFLVVLVLDKILVLAIVVALAIIILGISSRSVKIMLYSFLIVAGSFLLLYGVNFLAGMELSNFKVLIISYGFSIIIFVILILKSRLKRAAIVLVITVLSVFYVFSVDFAFQNILDTYQQRRINIMLGLESDPHGAGYNLAQSKIAIGSGGFNGKGYLNGTQTKLNFVPEQSTDFIFCTVGEEWGFLGSTLVVLLFVFLLLRLVYLAERQRSKFARIYGYGVLVVLFFHFFVNIAMTIGLFPVIGIPLPFFSYGGSSLWSFTILLFIFLRLDASRMEHIN